MKLTDLPRALLRRWYLLLVGLAITAGIGFVTLQHSPPTYEAQGRILMLPPAKSQVVGGNPFLNLDGLRLPADLVAQYMTGPENTTSFHRDHPTATFTVGLAITATNGPVLSIVAQDRTPTEALSALNAVISEVPEALTALEKSSNAPVNSSLRTMLLVRDDEAHLNSKDTIRALIVAVGAGLVGTFFLVFAVDGIVLWRNDRRQGRRNETVPDEDLPRAELPQRQARSGGRRRRVKAPATAAAATTTGIEPGQIDAGAATSRHLDDSSKVGSVPDRASVSQGHRAVRLRPASRAATTVSADPSPTAPADLHHVGTSR